MLRSSGATKEGKFFQVLKAGPGLQALAMRDAYEAEDDVDDAADEAEHAQHDREALAAAVRPLQGHQKPSIAQVSCGTLIALHPKRGALLSGHAKPLGAGHPGSQHALRWQLQAGSGQVTSCGQCQNIFLLCCILSPHACMSKRAFGRHLKGHSIVVQRRCPFGQRLKARESSTSQTEPALPSGQQLEERGTMQASWCPAALSL